MKERFMILFIISVLFSSSLVLSSSAVPGAVAPSSNSSAVSASILVADPSPAIATSTASSNRVGILAGELSNHALINPLSSNTSTARIWTDKSDYPPGSVVTIYGSGFTPAEVVALTLTQPNGTINNWNSDADHNGNFTTTFQIDSGALFYVTATDGTNTASTSFSDSVSAPSDQTTGASGGTSVTPTCVYGTSPTQNDLLVVAFLVSPSTITVGTPTDTLGNVFSLVTSKTGGSTVTFEIYMYAATESAVSASDTITLHFTGTVTDSYLTCFEVAGASSVVATSTSNSGTSTSGTSFSMTSASLTPTANNLVYAFAGYQSCGTSGSPTYTTGFTSMGSKGTSFTGTTNCHNLGNVKYQNDAQDEYEIPSSATASTAAMGITLASPIDTGTWGWAEIAVDFKLPASTTTASCIPSTVDVSVSSTCTATLSPSVATGTITWSATPPSDVNISPTTCALSSGSCSVTVTGALAGSVTITASYGGSTSYLPSSGSTTLTVNSALTVPTTPTLSAATIDVNQAETVGGTIPSTGTSPYSWTWMVSINAGGYSTATQCATNSGTGASANAAETCSISASTLTAGNTYNFELKVTDTAGAIVTSSASATLTVHSALIAPVISVSPITIDSGQSSTLSTPTSFSGGTSTYTCQWLAKAPGGSYVNLGSSFTSGCTTSSQPTVSTGTLSTVGLWSFELQVTDSSGTPVTVTSSPVVVNVNSVLSAGTITPSIPTIDSGQSITLTANPSGGTTPYAYQWYSGSSVTCSSDTTLLGTAATQSVSPSSSTYYCYKVTDSSAGTPTASVTSSTDLLTVNSALTAGAITPSGPTIDSGQSITLTANPSGGTTPYSYQWYTGSSATCSLDTTLLGTASTQSVSPTSNTYYCYKVTDASTGTPNGASSSTDLVTVDAALLAGAITPSVPTIDSGQSVTLSTNPSGGTGSYSYQWYTGSSTTCSSDTTALGTASTQSVSPTSNTYYCYSLTDTSTNPPTVSSSTDLVNVNNALSAGAITPSSPTIDNGQSVTLTSHVSGGTPALSYLWYTGAACTSVISGQTGSTYVASPTTTTTYYYKVTDSALSPVSQCSAADTVTVNPALLAGSITPSAPTIDNGQSITLTANPSVGTGSNTFQWYSGSSATCSLDTTLLGTASTQSVSPTSNAYYCYSVTDTSTNPPTVASSTDLVTVNPVLTAGAVTPSSPTIDNGQSVTLTSHATGGTPALFYLWYTGAACTSVISGQTGSTYTASPSSTTTYYYKVTDSAYLSASQCSAGDTVTVASVLVAGGITPSSPTIDSGQSITLTANPSGGTTPYSYQWYTGAACTSLISGQT
ncbi:MAG: hypothetical protein ABSE82_02805, partial [Nitrososphaerales archaeon]